MTAAVTIRAAVASGIRIKLGDRDRLRLSAARRPDDHLLEELRREKTEIVNYLRGLASWTDEDWRALFDERAGIMEFDGGLSREEAEERARDEVGALRRFVVDIRHG